MRLRAGRGLCGMIPLLLLAACHGQKAESAAAVHLPGYWFQLILIVVPLFILLVKGLMDLAGLKDSLLGLGSQTRRVISRLEDLEEKIKALEKPGKSHTEKEE